MAAGVAPPPTVLAKPAMSTNSLSGQNSSDTTCDRDDVEPIDDVRDLEEGDEIIVGDRFRPIVVDDTGTRQLDTLRGERTQHAVEASGEWADAVSVLLVNRIHRFRGHHTGEISVDLGAPEPVWRVTE